MMETILAVFTGIGLSAACGFRVFVPLLALNAVIIPIVCFIFVASLAIFALFKAGRSLVTKRKGGSYGM